jgi:hypothetical protein
MNIHEIDWRIEPLHDIIVGIEAGLTTIRQRLEEEDDDGITACDHAEPLLGLGFVAAQAYVLGTWTDLNHIRSDSAKIPISKSDCYASDSIKVRDGITRIHVINAAANYFKHHDEWTAWPKNETARILASIGITKDTEFPCIHTVQLLCGPAWRLIVLHQIVKEWREHVIRTLQ